MAATVWGPKSLRRGMTTPLAYLEWPGHRVRQPIRIVFQVFLRDETREQGFRILIAWPPLVVPVWFLLLGIADLVATAIQVPSFSATRRSCVDLGGSWFRARMANASASFGRGLSRRPERRGV
jgi:hypothetical protein